MVVATMTLTTMVQFLLLLLLLVPITAPDESDDTYDYDDPDKDSDAAPDDIEDDGDDWWASFGRIHEINTSTEAQAMTYSSWPSADDVNSRNMHFWK